MMWLIEGDIVMGGRVSGPHPLHHGWLYIEGDALFHRMTVLVIYVISMQSATFSVW